MTFRATYTPNPQLPFLGSPQASTPLTGPEHTSPELFGTLIMEITTPTGEFSSPHVPGWELRVWPVARLGDATLEAQPLYAPLTPNDLREALAATGYGVLGPIRIRSAKGST